jgi:hypothetical protein
MSLGYLPRHRDALRLVLRSSNEETLLNEANIKTMDTRYPAFRANLPLPSPLDVGIASLVGCQRTGLLSRAPNRHQSRRASLQLLLQAALTSAQQRRAAEQEIHSMLRASIQRNIERQMASTPMLSTPTISTSSYPSSLLDAIKTRKDSLETSVSQTLVKLGSSIRRRSDSYVDCAALGRPSQNKDWSIRHARSESFPMKVFRMLQDTEDQGLTDIASFFSHGRAFGVHDEDRFVKEILPKYFNQTKLSSFTRQLALWGFLRIRIGHDIDGGFYHDLFLNGRPDLCVYMKRVGAPGRGIDRRKCRTKSEEEVEEPDFYAMKPVRF